LNTAATFKGQPDPIPSIGTRKKTNRGADFNKQMHKYSQLSGGHKENGSSYWFSVS